MGKHNEIEYPAQPDNLPADRAVALLERSVDALQTIASIMRTKMPRAGREAARRRLAGVVADIESVRYAMKGPR